jgi:hypothetical protein
MSSIRTSNTRRVALDHFEPEADLDPQAQRRLRGHLEQIDYTAYLSNREVVAGLLGQAATSKFQRLAVATAQARALWIAEALKLSETGRPLTREETERLSLMRTAFDELTEAYEGLRRLVERGHLNFPAPAPATPSEG